MTALLALDHVSKRFGGLRAVHDVSFRIDEGEVLFIVGPNGAGKTTLFNLITGFLQPDEGVIRFAGRSLAGTPPHKAARLGIGRTFQIVKPLRNLTVLENVMLGAHPRLRGGPISWSLRVPPTAKDERTLRAQALDLLDRFGLGWAAQRTPDEMSHGLHKGIELCRAMLLQPRLLLLDEPAAGLPHSEVDGFIEQVRRMRADFDITIVIVEHHMGLISALTDRVVVLDHGRKLMEGTAAQAQADARVIEAYIGKDAADDAA